MTIHLITFSLFIGSITQARKPNSEAANTILKQFQFLQQSRNNPKERPVFLKEHAHAVGVFVIEKDLPKKLRVGVFAKAQAFPAWIRFSSDTIPSTADSENNTLGFAVKIFAKNSREEIQSQNFLLQNHPSFFLDTPQEFADMTAAIFSGKADEFFMANERNRQIKRNLDAMPKDVDSLLNSSYWSTTPYKFGEQIVKYKVNPIIQINNPNKSGRDYLRIDLKNKLAPKGAYYVFNFYLQFYKNENETPIEKPSIEWKTDYIKVASIIIPTGQNTLHPNRIRYTRNLVFHPGQAHPEHSPIGAINKARVMVYEVIGKERREKHGYQTEEPSSLPDNELDFLKAIFSEKQFSPLR